MPRRSLVLFVAGGAMVLVGVPPFGQEISIPAAMLPLEEKSLVGSLYGSANMRRDIPNLIALYMQKRLKLDEFIAFTKGWGEPLLGFRNGDRSGSLG